MIDVNDLTVSNLCFELLDYIENYGDYKVETRLLNEDGEHVYCDELDIYHEGFNCLHIEPHVCGTSETNQYTLKEFYSLLESISESSRRNAEKYVVLEQSDTICGWYYANAYVEFEVEKDKNTFIIKGMKY